jgi:pimeloyl-ACP methyl ester carboxylesterase
VTSPSLLFLPGGSGRGEFWDPIRDELRDLRSTALDWPGLGDTPVDPSVASYDGLVDHVISSIGEPVAIVGQSMGGYVAARVALAVPHLVTHLVLAVTSAGLDMASFGAADWRPGAKEARPDDPAWIYVDQPDLSASLPELAIPVLLLWASGDAISPLAVGERLAELLPRSELVVYDSTDHWVVREQAVDVAVRIRRHVAGRADRGVDRGR